MILEWLLSRRTLVNLAGFAVQCLLVLYFARPLPKRPRGWRRRTGHLCLLGLLCLYLLPFSFATRDLPDTTYNFSAQALRALVMWGIVSLFLLLAYELPRAEGVYRAGIFTVIYLASLNTRFILISTLNRSDLLIFLQLVTLGTELLLLYLIRGVIDVQKIESADMACWFMLLLSAFLELYFKWTLISILELPEKALNHGNWIIFAFFATFGVLLMLIQFEHNRQIQKEKLQIELERMSLGYEMQNAKRALQTNNDIRRLYHDMKNHLLALKNMQGGTAEMAHYLDDLLPQFEGYESQVFTGNATVDALLSEKTQRAALDDIHFNICMELSALAQVRSVDMVTIFGNAVDNAIEAVQMLPDKKDAIIYLKSTRFANLVVLKFSNRFVGRLEAKNGVLATSKKEEALHGIGLASIQKAAQRYGGSAKPTFDNATGWFTLNVILPIQK